MQLQFKKSMRASKATHIKKYKYQRVAKYVSY